MHKILQYQQTHFGFMDVALLRSGHQHVSATQVGGNKNKNYIYILVLTTLMMTT